MLQCLMPGGSCSTTELNLNYSSIRQQHLEWRDRNSILVHRKLESLEKFHEEILFHNDISLSFSVFIRNREKVLFQKKNTYTFLSHWLRKKNTSCSAFSSICFCSKQHICKLSFLSFRCQGRISLANPNSCASLAYHIICTAGKFLTHSGTMSAFLMSALLMSALGASTMSGPNEALIKSFIFVAKFVVLLYKRPQALIVPYMVFTPTYLFPQFIRYLSRI